MALSATVELETAVNCGRGWISGLYGVFANVVRNGKVLVKLSGYLDIKLKGLAKMNTTYSPALADVLPEIVVVMGRLQAAANEAVAPQPFQTKIRSTLTRKVVTNASFLMNSSRKDNACSTLADCLADATGLFVDFKSLGL